MYFQELFIDDVNSFEQKRIIALKIAKNIKEGKSIESEIAQFWEFTINLLKPLDFSSQDDSNEEIKIDKSYLNLCNFMSENTQRDISKCSVKEFYSLLSYLKDKYKKKTHEQNNI